MGSGDCEVESEYRWLSKRWFSPSTAEKTDRNNSQWKNVIEWKVEKVLKVWSRERLQKRVRDSF